MSRQGQGYSRGPPANNNPTQQHAQQQQQQRNPYAPPPTNPRSSPHQPQYQQGGAAYQEQHHGHSLSTVSEKDEPVSSPDMGRRDQGFGHGGPDPYSGHEQQQQYSHYDQQQQYPDYSYDQQQQQQQGYDEGGYSGYDQQQQGGADGQQPQFEAPYYPGWVYNPQTNSYDPDTNYNPDDVVAQDQGGQVDDSQGQQQAGYDAGYSYDQQQQQHQQGDAQHHEYSDYTQQYSQTGEQENHDERFNGYSQDDASGQQQHGAYNESNDFYGQQQQQQQHEASTAAAGQDQEDPYANDPYSSDPYADDGYNAFASDGYDAYGSTQQQQQQGVHDEFGAPTPHAEQQDPYSADSNPYAEDEQQADPFAQLDAQDPYGVTGSDEQQHGESYGESAGEHDPYGSSNGYGAPQHSQYEPYGQQAPPHDQAPPAREPPKQNQQQQAPQQAAYDPYAPRASAAAPAPAPAPASRAAASPPLRTAYSPPLAQQQYSSFAAFGQSAAEDEAPHDPYAPPTRGAPQPQRRQQPAYDPYASPSLQKDAFDGYASQRSPPVQQQQLPQAYQGAPPPASERSVASPPARNTALSPPPRTSSAASNTSARQAAPAAAAAAPPPPRAMPAAAPPKRNVPPPLQATPARVQGEAPAPSPKQTTPSQMASPRTEAAAALASPPPRSRPLPAHAQKQAPPTAGAAFDVPPPRNAPPPRAQPAPKRDEPRAAPPPAAAPAERPAPPKEQDPRRPPPQRKSEPSAPAPAPAPARAPAASPYAAPPPPQPVLPPSQRKAGPGSASGLRPPVARAPHQRGASAFGSDSPYGALPSGPLTSSYEPPRTVDEGIKEEEDEEEVPPAVKEEEQDEQDHVPSWMQATTPAARPPFYPKTEPEEPVMPKQEDEDQRAFAPERVGAPSSRRDGDDLAGDMAAMSLGNDRRSQGPLPPRPGGSPPPPRQQPQQGGAPPPRAGSAAPPPRGPAGAPPPAKSQPPPARAGPPPRGQPGQRQAPQARPPHQQQQQQRGGPPRNGLPPDTQLPTSPDRGQVPQLHFEAPSPEVRPDRRADPYGYAGGRSSPMPMAGIEETPEPSEHEDSYGGGASEEQTTQAGESQYGGDDSIVYHPHGDEEQTGLTTPSSAYGGEWRADSAESQGYDYISSGYQAHRQPAQQQQSRPHDPYAPSSQQQQHRSPYAPAPPAQRPRDVPSRESTFTPPAPAQRGPPSQYAASPRKAAPLQPPSASSMARANSYDAPPSRPMDSYSPYAQPPPQHEKQQQAYNPYAPQQAATISRPGSAMAGPPADLGLERRTAPVATFGFGGKLVLVFPNGGRRSFGMDSSNPYGVAAAPGTGPESSSPTTVHIRKLADVAPSAALPQQGATSTFPGPVFLDGGKANAGKKRKEAVAWLAQRIAELEQEAQYAHGAAPSAFAGSGADAARGKVETRLLLVRLVRIMIENEGKLVGSPAVDDAVRALFAPAEAGEGGALPTADQLAAAASSGPSGSDAPFVSYGVSASNLDDMSKFLLRGERREAVAYALDNRMWAHAFIIASCVDTDCWKEVTVEFLRSELSPESAGPGAEGREALRVAYGMFAGLGTESIHQFIPPRALGPATPGLLPAAPVGNNGVASAPLSRVPSDAAAKLPEQTLAKWRETVGMIVANRTAGDSGALTALGDALAANGWTDAAHICYLLSPQTSLAMGFGLPGSRITLVGSNPTAGDGGIELESIQLTELVEFALSLVPTVKGHEPFAGFPHLQAFRLYHAAALADAGHAAQAHKYTEAIVNTLKLATKPSPFYHPRLVAQIKALSERLGASHNVKEGGSWITRKVPRPTVNSLWSTFEGGFNKFVAGDDEPSAQQLAAKAEVQKATNGQTVGAFSHFSSIAPGSNSGTLSRAQSSTDLAGSNFLHANPPARPLSAQRASSPLASPSYPQQQQQQQQHQSPGPPPVKRAPFKTHHARSSSLGAFAGYDYNPTAPPPSWLSSPPANKRGESNGDAMSASDGPRIADTFTDSPRRDRGDASGAPSAPSSARRPQFRAVDEELREDESGFISPMAHLTPSVSPAPQAGRAQQTHRRMTTAEELADLGLANNKSKKPVFDTLDEELEAEEGGVTPTKEHPSEPSRSDAAAGPSSSSSTAAAANDSKAGAATSGSDGDKPSIKPSKSWLGGWFKREASPANQGPGPVRANLGEKTSLYYDEKLKRWINKGDKVEAPPAIVPPPRAATASPSKSMRNSSPRFGGDNVPPVPSMPPRSATTGPPPLSRSATSADLRSDSRPPSRPPSAGPPRSGGATPEGGAPAPARGPRKNKPRYVVVAP